MNAIIIEMKILLYITLSSYKMQVKIMNYKIDRKIKKDAKKSENFKKKLKFINVFIVFFENIFILLNQTACFDLF